MLQATLASLVFYPQWVKPLELHSAKCLTSNMSFHLEVKFVFVLLELLNFWNSGKNFYDEMLPKILLKVLHTQRPAGSVNTETVTRVQDTKLSSQWRKMGFYQVKH